MNIILHPQAVHDMTPCQVMGLIEEPPHRDRLVSYGRGTAYASKKNETLITPGFNRPVVVEPACYPSVVIGLSNVSLPAWGCCAQETLMPCLDDLAPRA